MKRSLPSTKKCKCGHIFQHCKRIPHGHAFGWFTRVCPKCGSDDFKIIRKTVKRGWKMTLAQKLKSQRRYLGYTVKHVAENVQAVSESQLIAFELGKKKPTHYQLLSLAVLYKVTISELMDSEPTKRPVFLLCKDGK